MTTAPHICSVCYAPLSPETIGDLHEPARLHAGVHLLCDRQECRDALDAEEREERESMITRVTRVIRVLHESAPVESEVQS